jgi:hypothetical protein
MTTSMQPPEDQPGPLFWMGARALTHVGEFRRYYALFAVWVLVMVAVPRAGLVPALDAAADGSSAGRPAGMARSAGGPSESATAAGAIRPVSGGAATFFSDPLFDVLPSDVDLGDDDSAAFAAPALTASPSSIPFTPPTVEEEETPEAPADPASPAIDIPPPPAIPVPAPPAELVPLLSIVSPLGNTACSPIGLAGVVFALVAPSVQQVPAGEIVPYLTPLYVACGTFPQTGPRTVCELDDLYVSQDPTGGLLPPPAVIGIGIDTITQLELASGAGTSQSQALREQLHCHRG